MLRRGPDRSDRRHFLAAAGSAALAQLIGCAPAPRPHVRPPPRPQSRPPLPPAQPRADGAALRAPRDLTLQSTAWMDRHWDDATGLLWYTAPEPYAPLPHLERLHVVRETTWYALGLLLRGRAEDRPRAARALEAVLAHQVHAPGAPIHGTWVRAPEELPLPPDPQPGLHFDPNWREFIGTTLVLILLTSEPALPRPLVQGMEKALQKAVEGALTRPVPASYTNIALMRAFLLDAAGARFGEPAWVEAGAALAQDIHGLFDEQGTFPEYNSPTYYGVDLYALALWRSHARSPVLRALGANMESRLWADIAALYHAGLRNLCGPYYRTYGMDLGSYAGVLGLWIWAAAGRALAPFPDPGAPFVHSNDFCFAPCVALLSGELPGEVLAHFKAFQGERLVERMILGARPCAHTAWLGKAVMLGGLDMGGEPGIPRPSAATVHWRITGSRDVGWLRLAHDTPARARAEERRLSIEVIAAAGATDLVFEIGAPGALPAAIRADRWELPGLALRVEGNAGAPLAKPTEEHLEVRYPAPPGKGLGGARLVLSLA